MPAPDTQRVLVTGALGQIGSELVLALRERHGAENVVATDLRPPEDSGSGPAFSLDVTDRAALEAAVTRHRIDTVYHMAAILSAAGERRPDVCWDVNVGGTKNVLDVGVAVGLRRIFVPSSIAAFGPEVPRDRTPDETVLRPRSVYGITKVAGDLLVDYYGRRYDLDCRGVRYPGLISHATAPGGGTTDYAVAIYFEAVQSGRYECFVREDTCLPMMYMPDAIKATLQIMAAPRERLTRRGDYNLGAMSFTVGEQAASIRELVPDFTVSYVPDYRQAIAESWPRSVDDRAARADWDWTPDFDLDAMTRDMIAALRRKQAAGALEG